MTKKLSFLSLCLLGGALIVKAAMADAILPPANFIGVSNSPTSINLTWEAAAGAVSYEIFRNNNSIATTSALALTDSALLPNTLYAYAIQSIDTAGNHSANSQIAVATQKDETDPAVPTGLTGEAVSQTAINLKWNASTDNITLSGYNIYRDGALKATTTLTAFSDIVLTASTTYSYAVSAVDTSGNESEKTSLVSVTTLKAPVVPPVNSDWNIKIDNGYNGRLVNLKSNQKVKISIYSNKASSTLPDLNNITLGGALPVEIKIGKLNKDNVSDYTFEFRAQDMKSLLDGDTKIIFEMALRNGEVIKKEFAAKVKNAPKRKIISKPAEKFINSVEKSVSKILKGMDKKDEKDKKDKD